MTKFSKNISIKSLKGIVPKLGQSVSLVDMRSPFKAAQVAALAARKPASLKQ